MPMSEHYKGKVKKMKKMTKYGASKRSMVGYDPKKASNPYKKLRSKGSYA